MSLPRPVWIVDGVRTPIGRYGGALAGVRTDDLGAIPIKALMQRNAGVDWSQVDDVIYGCANGAGEDNRNVARMAALLAGLPTEVAGATLNRLCGSGLDAVATCARTIASGEAELMIAGGVESMTRAPFVLAKADSAFSRSAKIEDTTIGWRFVNPLMKSQHGIDSMPETAENVAAEFKVSRADQDAFALRSQERWQAAHKAGFFDGETVPVAIAGKKKGETTQFAIDEHPRATTLDALAALKGVVKPDGTVTAGNASGVNDGSCALLIASDAALKKHNLKPRARIIGAAVAGVPPRIMGIGPAPATQKLLARLGWAVSELDVIELNEAFAAQGLAVTRQLGLADDDARVNPNGGAIAIGHPLGASGARLALTALRQLERTGGRRGLATMCIGVGQGIALALERAS
jgi:3-oxoadipyl-CoA thiolase